MKKRIILHMAVAFGTAVASLVALGVLGVVLASEQSGSPIDSAGPLVFVPPCLAVLAILGALAAQKVFHGERGRWFLSTLFLSIAVLLLSGPVVMFRVFLLVLQGAFSHNPIEIFPGGHW